MILLVMKKELKSYFKSPLAYVLAGLFALMTGWIFFNLLVSFADNIQQLSKNTQYDFINTVVIRLFGNLNFLLLFISPILTMKLFAEEKKDSTIDLYYASGIEDYQLVLGKYFASVTMAFFLIGTTVIFPIIMWMVKLNDISILFTGYLGLMLNVMCYLAIGLFASSITDNQAIAALVSFVFIMGFWLMSWAIQISSSYFVVEIIKYVTMVNHFELLVKGIVSTSSFVFYISFVFIWIFLTKKVIESRNW